MSTNETEQLGSEHPSRRRLEVRVNGEAVSLEDRTPTGRQVLAAANLRPDTEFALLLWPEVGPTREIGLEEVTAVPREGPPLEFLATRADGIAYFVLDGERYAWAGHLDTEAVRHIGRVPANHQVWLERRDEPDVQLEPGQAVDLRAAGVERLYTRPNVWRLDVQGEPTEWSHPDVLVREALLRAGIDLTKSWMIVLKVKGKEPRPVELNDVIDLDQPGIERLWLRPRHVDNGEGPVPRREFALLPKDEAFLTASDYRWEAIMDGARRWLIVDDYAVPKGLHRVWCGSPALPERRPAGSLVGWNSSSRRRLA